MAKKPAPFNNPFGTVKLATPAAKTAPAPVSPKRQKPVSVDEDAALFLEAVGEVERVRSKPTKVGPPPPRKAEDLHIPTEEAESLARLAELVAGEGAFEVSDSDDFIEGSVRGFDARVMKKLRAGDFSTQAHVDLHGLTRDEAKPALEDFIAKSRVAGHRCVLIVTGKGLHSKDEVPVLKQSVQAWLTHGRSAKQVLAFSSARPKDGGTGAVYVLLRR